MYYLIELVCNSLTSYAEAGPARAAAADRQQETQALDASTAVQDSAAVDAEALHATLQKAAGARSGSAVAAAAALQRVGRAASSDTSTSSTYGTSSRVPHGDSPGFATLGPDAMHAALQAATAAAHSDGPDTAVTAAGNAKHQAAATNSSSSSNNSTAGLNGATAEGSKLTAVGRLHEGLHPAADGQSSPPAAAAAAAEGARLDTAGRSTPATASDSSSSSGGSNSSGVTELDPTTSAAAAADQTRRQEANSSSSSSSSTADKLREMLHKKPCRACTTATDMFSAAFKASQLAHGGSSSSSADGSRRSAVSHAPHSSVTGDTSGRSSSGEDGSTAPSAAAAAAAAAASAIAALASSTGASTSSSSAELPPQCQDAQPPPLQQQQKQPFWFYEDEMPCPPDILELGRATWTLLHSMAAYYPEEPTAQQKQQMSQFVNALGEFYPCQECAGHLRKELAKHPPDVGSATALSDWACRLHNLVNVRLGKPEFDCSHVFQRWRDGPADDEDACPSGH